MKNKPNRNVADHPSFRWFHRPGSPYLTVFLGALLALSACTQYRPLDRGADVPWAKALAVKQGGPLDGSRYRVGRGDSLGRIAERYGVRLTTLASANNIAAPYVLYPGEVLTIPDDAPLPTRRPATSGESRIVQAALPPVETPEPEIAAAPDRQEAQPIHQPRSGGEGKKYTVARGESLSHIAARHGLRLGDLVATNDIEPPYKIRPGQTLFIPVSEGEKGKTTTTLGAQTAAGSSDSSPPPLSAEGFLWPVDGDLIGRFEENSEAGRSGGVNIAARKGAPVRAADNGIVAYAGEALSGYGRMVMLRHADGYVTLYAHNDVMLVREGEIVRRGQTIAEVGNSGDVSKSQLHFELRKAALPIDPTKVIAGLPGRQIGRL